MSTVNNDAPYVSQDLLNSVNTKRDNKPAEGSVEADTDKFMTLLVTQLRNQDPLNPLDNAQITSQLAQLSTVTGVNKLNTTLESLKSSYQSSEALAATNLLGHGVLVEGNYVKLIDGQAIMGVELATPADNVQLIITDVTTGKPIQVMDLGANPAGVMPIAWDGVVDPTALGPDGKPVVLKNGTYLLTVVAERAGETLDDAKTLSFDSVVSVTTSATEGIKLNLPTKGIVGMADIKQVM